MTRGVAAPDQPHPHRARLAPLALALSVYAAGAAFALTNVASEAAAPITAAETTVEPAPQTAAIGNWQVTSGSLGFGVQQMGAAVDGSFAGWQARITYDDTITEGPAGRVEVDIDLTSVTLGSVTDQAKGPDFFDVANHPTARFAADLIAGPQGLHAEGVLSLRGKDHPVTLPFTLQITGDTATMTGSAQLDRRDFGIGATYDDEATVGFGVEVKVALEAQRL